MAEDESGEKTELPTEHRREKAREQGNVVKSQDLAAAGLMLASGMILWFQGGSATSSLVELMRGSLAADPWLDWDRNRFVSWGWATTSASAVIVLPITLLLAAAAVGANFAQVGVLLTTETLMPNWNRINPMSGFQRIFSMSSVARLIGSILKAAIFSVVAGIYIWQGMDRLRGLPRMSITELAATSGSELVSLTLLLAGAVLGAAVLDYGFQWWKHEQDLKMSKQEIREEMKSMDGDPHIRMRRREAHKKLTQSREMAAVKTADVVVTNPTEIAVAIRYDAKTMNAPTVVAKGAGEIAARIRRLAAEHGVPIIERKPVARALYKSIKVGQAIPADMYGVFAEILAYIYRISGKKR